jgi:hypothetical protein
MACDEEGWFKDKDLEREMQLRVERFAFSIGSYWSSHQEDDVYWPASYKPVEQVEAHPQSRDFNLKRQLQIHNWFSRNCKGKEPPKVALFEDYGDEEDYEEDEYQ